MRLEDKVSPDVLRRLDNWARWRVASGAAPSSSCLARLVPRGSRAEASMPLINGEAVETDRLVDTLPGRYADTIQRYYLRTGTDEDHARQRGVALNTWRVWVVTAHEEFLAALRRHQAAQAARRAQWAEHRALAATAG